MAMVRKNLEKFWKNSGKIWKNMEKCLENYPMFGKPDFFKNCSSCSIF